jgi:hypothetical protein
LAITYWEQRQLYRQPLITFTISNYANTTNFKPATWHGAWFQGSNYRLIFGGVVSTNSAITSIVLSNTGGSLTAGTLLLYGVS